MFEERIAKDPAVLSDIDDLIEFLKDYKSKKKIRDTWDKNDKIHKDYIIIKGRTMLVNKGETVKHGDLLVDGNIVLQDILRILGVAELAVYFVNEVQKVFRLQGVPINVNI